jgi:hypothetical protein
MEKRIVFAFVMLSALAGTALATNYYVDGTNGNDSNLGTSWAAAKQTFGAGLALAVNPVDVVNVAAGTYTAPGAAWVVNNSMTLLAKAGDTVVLSGDINGDDTFADLLLDKSALLNACVSGNHLDNKPILNLSGTGKIITVDGFTISGSNGTAVSCSSATVALRNCLFTQNCNPTGTAGCIGSSSTTVGNLNVENCRFIQNTANDRGSCVYIRYGTPLTVKNSIFSVNSTIGQAGTIYLRDHTANTLISDCILDRSIMVDNVGGCAGIMVSSNTAGAENLKVTNCIFKDCETHDHGAAMYMVTRATSTLTFTADFTNSLITGSKALVTGQSAVALFTGLYAGSPHALTLNVNNCTITNNTPSGAGVIGAWSWGATGGTNVVNLKNSILWNNPGPSSNAQILIDTAAAGYPTVTVTANYCDWDNSDPNDFGNAQSLGTNNIHTDPLFNAAYFQDTGYFLASNSPCKNTGNNAYVPADAQDVDGDGNVAEATPDLAFRNRIGGGTVDMGAYEYYRAGDVNGSDRVNLEDFEALAAGWLDSNCDFFNQWCGRADANHSSSVDMTDLNKLTTEWLQQ